MTGLSGGERISTIGLAVLTQYKSATDGQTDRQNCRISMSRVAFMNECERTIKITICCPLKKKLKYVYKPTSDVVLETNVLVSRRLEDKITSLGLDLGLDKKVLSILKPISSLLMTNNHDIIV